MSGGLLRVFAARSPTTAGSTGTAPAGGFAGPAARSAHTRAAGRAADGDGAALGSAGAPGVLTQPVAATRASTGTATGNPRCRRSIPTRPPSPGT